MHAANRLWWELCRDKYPGYFHDQKVLEAGSLNVNGTVRDYFTECDYTGIDFRAGKDVDLVCLCHQMPFAAETFDVVISASMLEHDPYWYFSLQEMVRVLRPDGILLLSWGTMLNRFHYPQTCPDYYLIPGDPTSPVANPKAFHPLAVELVMVTLRKLGLTVAEFRYEGNLPGMPRRPKSLEGKGEAGLIAFKDESLIVGKPHLDKLRPEDRIGPPAPAAEKRAKEPPVVEKRPTAKKR